MQNQTAHWNRPESVKAAVHGQVDFNGKIPCGIGYFRVPEKFCYVVTETVRPLGLTPGAAPLR